MEVLLRKGDVDMWLALFIAGIFLSPFILLLMLWIVGIIGDVMNDAVSGMQGWLGEQRHLRRQRRLECLSDVERTCLAMKGDLSALELITSRDELELIIKKAEYRDVRQMACGKLGHKWNGCVCEICGASNTSAESNIHQWDDCVCKICGAEAPDAKHDWELINQESTENESDEWYGGHFVRMTSVTEINTYRCRKCGKERQDVHTGIS
jgi:hypothetical protein